MIFINYLGQRAPVNDYNFLEDSFRCPSLHNDNTIKLTAQKLTKWCDVWNL